MPNLVKAYKLFKGCSEAEAVIQVLADSEWVNTLDEDDLDEEDMELHAEKGNKSPYTKSHYDDASEFSADSKASEYEAEEMETVDPAPMANKNDNSREDRDGGQADHNTDITAAMGLFNLSQNPTFQLPNSPKVFDHDMVLPAFAGSVHSFYSPTQPHSILCSQDVPDVFKNGTPFLDLLFAQTQPATPSPKTHKQLAEIDQRILREGEYLNNKDSEDEDDSTFVLSRKMIHHLGELGSQCEIAMNKLDQILDDMEKL
ncbi:unnamed protein product [Calypogeia fissa]